MTNINGRSRGFAILLFRTQEEAVAFTIQMHGKEFKGRILAVRVGFDDNCALNKISTVFMGKLDRSAQEEDLRSLFSNYGTIQAVTIKRNNEGKSKGWG